jgi:putative 4-mercaptohistidine N1-methyltranferase
MTGNYYDTDRAVAEYLLFHYGLTEPLLPAGLSLAATLDFPVRCVTECVDVSRLPARARALDLGCAVGRASFELARRCSEVVGIDYSDRFIKVAEHLKANGSFLFGCIEQGELSRPCHAVVSAEIDRRRVAFEQGDALNLRPDLGRFDVVLMANLIDRLSDPHQCLERLPALLNSGGQLIITSPYTWLEDYTPRPNWLGGFEQFGQRIQTLTLSRTRLPPISNSPSARTCLSSSANTPANSSSASPKPASGSVSKQRCGASASLARKK